MKLKHIIQRKENLEEWISGIDNIYDDLSEEDKDALDKLRDKWTAEIQDISCIIDKQIAKIREKETQKRNEFEQELYIAMNKNFVPDLQFAVSLLTNFVKYRDISDEIKEDLRNLYVLLSERIEMEFSPEDILNARIREMTRRAMEEEI